MRIPLDLDGFEDHEVVVETAGLLSNAKILLDGKRAPKGSKRNTYVLRSTYGFKVIIELKQSIFDPVPRLIVDGYPIKYTEALSPIQWIWSGLPMVLIIIGGAIGGAFGATAFWINMRVFRGDMSEIEKYILTGLISAIATIVYLLLGTLVVTAIEGLF
jgi:hypothetical protein